MARMKISDTYDPAQWTYTRVDNPDGSGVFYFDNGAVVSFPPLPGEEWQDKVSRRLCEIQYGIRRRIALEALQNEQAESRA